jgi:small ligand-binding sensory domain FIST
MQWASTISTTSSTHRAVGEALDRIADELDRTQPDLVFVFASPHHREHYAELPSLVRERFSSASILGCSGSGVIGRGQEVEEQSALSMMAGVLPGVELTTFHLGPDELPDRDAVAQWRARVGVSSDPAPHFVLLADPFTTDPMRLVDGLDAAYDGAVKVGGLASGASGPGETVLYAGGEAYGTGVVGLGLAGNVGIDTIVAQGCRPVGAPMFVTRSARNVIQRLDGRAPSVVVQQLYEAADPRDRQLMRHSLFLGLVMSDSQQVYDRGDFLIRNIVGLDAESGAMTVGALVRPKTVVQFHLRDATTSADDLEDLLGDYAAANPRPPAGALLFSCVGRGRRLYGHANHDSDAFAGHQGPIPLGGFFCNGEIGPVRGRTFLHGYTSCFALFRRKAAN